MSLPTRIQQDLHDMLVMLQPDAELLNMLAHVELIRSGDYKKLKNRLLNLMTDAIETTAEKMVVS